MSWKSATRSVAAAVLVLMSAACVPIGRDDRVDMKEADLVGDWTSTDSRTFTFDAGGRFVATGLPHQKLERFTGVLPPGFDPARDKLDGSGEWKLEAPRDDPRTPRNHVDLFLRQLSGRQVAVGMDLRVERRDGKVVLAYYLSDPDQGNRIVYEKCEQPCAGATPEPTATG